MVDDPYIKGSLRMGVYGRTGTDGKMDYVIANAGTDPTSLQDWKNDIQQPFGASADMRNSLKYAKDFVVSHSDANITFAGHSKGGAEAAANAVKTNKNAILFNPATVNLKAYGLDSSTFTGEMTTYIVKGEILNNIFGPISKPIGSVVYLPTQYSVNTPIPALNMVNSIRNHFMSAVKQAINEYEEE